MSRSLRRARYTASHRRSRVAPARACIIGSVAPWSCDTASDRPTTTGSAAKPSRTGAGRSIRRQRNSFNGKPPILAANKRTFAGWFSALRNAASRARRRSRSSGIFKYSAEAVSRSRCRCQQPVARVRRPAQRFNQGKIRRHVVVGRTARAPSAGTPRIRHPAQNPRQCRCRHHTWPALSPGQ